jgi:hypothetical protein
LKLAIQASIVCLAGWLAGAPARAEPPAVADAEVLVIAEGLDAASLGEALALRVPGARVVDRRDMSCGAGQSSGQEQGCEDMSCGAGCVVARIGRDADGALRVEVRGADGRLFRRVWAAELAEPERAAATALSHLLAAIADGTTEAAAEPEVASTVEPAVVATPKPAPRTVAREAPPRIEVGPTVGLVGVVGVGRPAALAGWVGSGGLVGVELRGRRGLVGGLELRGLGMRDGGLRLARVRAALSIGHSLRRGLFELQTRAAVTVEPWWVAARGERAQVGAPLLGGAVSLRPGVSARLAPRVRLDVGLRLEAAISVDPRRAAVVQLVDATATPLFRLGGVELAAAAEIGVRWGR